MLRFERSASNLAFRHLHRPLGSGEAIPALPGLLEQITAAQLAAEAAAALARREQAVIEAVADEEWDEDLAEAA